MSETFEDYQDLSGTGFQGGGGDQTAPEDEFFHSVYISGKPRKNHMNIQEESGKFQIRGSQYNLDEVNMVITHTKEMLAKIVSKGGRDNIECFSFKEGQAPWYGTAKLEDGNARACPLTSAERASNDFCNACKSQIIVAGIFCNPNGSPVLTEEKKPVFIFIRGKGMRYSNVSEYLNDMYNEELSPVFEPVTDQSKQFEKSVVNNKRFVTRITGSKQTSQYGNDVNIFVLEKGPELPKDTVLKILRLSKETVEKFNDKFDWSKRRQTSTTGYETPQQAEGVLPVDDSESKPEEVKAAPEQSSEKVFSFDDIDF